MSSCKPSRYRTLGIALVVCAVPIVGCEYFSDVVIPASDTTPPTVGVTLFQDGERTDRFGPNTPLQVVTHDPDETFAILGWMLDSGGAHKVTVHREITFTCVSGNLAQSGSFLLTGLAEETPGAPGDTVSNGLYAMEFITPGAYADSCNSGFTISSVTYRWGVTGEDFHGNTETWHEGGRITYRP